MRQTICVPVRESTQVSEVRRTAKQLALDLAFDERRVEETAIIVTEAATNLLKHGGGGEALLQSSSNQVEMVAIDRGPGMRDVPACMRDGFSTASSPGTGLGAMQRLSTAFDIYSIPGKGTVVATVIRPWKEQAEAPLMEVAGISVAKPGEVVCGDNWAVRHSRSGATILVADGLGHGEFAARASMAAAAGFAELSDGSPSEMLLHLHERLRTTRGAAAAIANINARSGEVSFSGIGNVATVIESSSESKHAVSMNGILGHQSRTLRDFSYRWTSSSVLVMLSDGLLTRWDFGGYPGLKQRMPLLIAGVLYRDLLRGCDDATVVVARQRET